MNMKFVQNTRERNFYGSKICRKNVRIFKKYIRRQPFWVIRYVVKNY